MAISSTLNTFRMAEKLSIPQLVQALQNHTIDASVGQLVLNNKLQEKKRMEAAQGGGAPQSTVADDNINEAGRMAGVAAAPMDPNAFRQQGFSGGGIVGYAGGGSVGEYFPLDEATRRKLREQGDAIYGSRKSYDYFPLDEITKQNLRERGSSGKSQEYFPLDEATRKRLREQGIDGAYEPSLGAGVRELGVMDTSTRPGAGFNIADTPVGQVLTNMQFGSGGGKDTSGASKYADAIGFVGDKAKQTAESLKGALGDYFSLYRRLAGGLPFGLEDTPGSAAVPPEMRPPERRPEGPQGPQGGAAGIASSLPGGVSFRAPQLQGYDEILKGNDPVARMRALSALRQGELEKGDTEAFSELRGDMDKQKGELAKDKEQNKWLSLMKAGFSMAGGDSQYALQNIGKGAEEGVNAFVQRDIINREMQNRLAMRDQAVKLEQIAMRKGNMAQADQYGSQAAQADQQAKQLSMQAVDAQNRNQMGIAGLNLEAQKVNQAAATQRAMLQMSKDRYSAMEKAAEARMMQARQKAVTDFMSSPMYSQLDAYLRNEYGKNWRFADDARSKEAQFIFGRKLQEHMQTTMPTIIEGMEGGGGGYPGVRDAYDLLNAE